MAIKPSELHAELNNLAFAARNVMNGVNWFREKLRKMPQPQQEQFRYELRTIYGSARRMLSGCRVILGNFPGIVDHQEKLLDDLREIIVGLEDALKSVK